MSDVLSRSRIEAMEPAKRQAFEQAVAVVAANKSFSYAAARAGIELGALGLARPRLEHSVRLLNSLSADWTAIEMAANDALVDEQALSAAAVVRQRPSASREAPSAAPAQAPADGDAAAVAEQAAPRQASFF